MSVIRWARLVNITCIRAGYLIISGTEPDRCGTDLISADKNGGWNRLADTAVRMGLSLEAYQLLKTFPINADLEHGHFKWYSNGARDPNWFFEWQGGINRIIPIEKLQLGRSFHMGGHITIPNSPVPPGALDTILKHMGGS